MLSKQYARVWQQQHETCLAWGGVVFTNRKCADVTNFVVLALTDGWRPVWMRSCLPQQSWKKDWEMESTWPNLETSSPLKWFLWRKFMIGNRLDIRWELLTIDTALGRHLQEENWHTEVPWANKQKDTLSWYYLRNSTFTLERWLRGGWRTLIFISGLVLLWKNLS